MAMTPRREVKPLLFPYTEHLGCQKITAFAGGVMPFWAFCESASTEFLLWSHFSCVLFKPILSAKEEPKVQR